MHAPTIPLDPAEQARRLGARRKRIAYEDANERQQCAVPRCYKLRAGFGKLCRDHRAVRAWSGHAEARPIKRRQTDQYERRWLDFLERFPDHPAIVAGEQWLDAFLADPRRWSRSQIVIDRIEAAHMRGARGPEMLKILAGVFFLSRYEPRVLPDDDRLTFLLAKRLISTWRKGRKGTTGSRDNAVKQGTLRRPTSTYREIGTIIRAHLGVLFTRVADRIDKDASESQALRTALHTPFVTVAEIAAAQQFNHEDEDSAMPKNDAARTRPNTSTPLNSEPLNPEQGHHHHDR